MHHEAGTTSGRPRPLDMQLCFALYRTSLTMTRAYRPMLDKLGLTYPQFLVLHALFEEDAISIGEIARRLSLESSTITPLVKRMEVAGYVRRERDSGDERYVLIRLTPAGDALQGELTCISDCVFERTGLSMEAVLGLVDQVAAVGAALQRTPGER